MKRAGAVVGVSLGAGLVVAVVRALRAAPSAAPSTPAGELLRAVRLGTAVWPPLATVRWASPIGPLDVDVGADAVRVPVGGELLRLPVSYSDVIELGRILDTIAPTYGLDDAIWNAATVRLDPRPQDVADPRSVARFSRDLDEQIAGRAGLVADVGKTWVLAARNRFPGAATTYGWRRGNGVPIQGRGPDDRPPAHNVAHADYSQTWRPVWRMARRPDGSRVDLTEAFRASGLPQEVLTPWIRSS